VVGFLGENDFYLAVFRKCSESLLQRFENIQLEVLTNGAVFAFDARNGFIYHNDFLALNGGINDFVGFLPPLREMGNDDVMGVIVTIGLEELFEIIIVVVINVKVNGNHFSQRSDQCVINDFLWAFNLLANNRIFGCGLIIVLFTKYPLPGTESSIPIFLRYL
jgi:hypothetical protein